MEEKELSTTISASPVNSESDAAVTQPPSNHRNDVVVETNNNMSTGIVTTTTTTTTEGLRFGSGATASFSPTAGKKRRGRPRKYDADGNLRVSYASPKTTPFTLSSPGSDQFSSSSNKRGRGRPSGSANWQLLASLGEIFASTAGGDFTPHVVTVGTGEDVAGKIISFTEKGPRGICVLAANGSVSNVTIRQPGSSGGILTYEGRFEILSLTGSFTVTEISGGRSRTGGLSVSLAGPDGRVIGGGLAGLLTAASPIQIVVGSFMPNGYKAQKRKYNTVASDTVSFASPISQAKPAAEISNPTLLQQQPNVVVEVPQADHQKLTPTITTTTTTTTVMSSEKSNPNNGAAAAINFAAYNGAELARPDLGGHGHRSPDINMSIPGDL